MTDTDPTHSTDQGPTRRTALVTGGGSGIGRAAALALAEAGLDVLVTGRAGRDRRPAPRIWNLIKPADSGDKEATPSIGERPTSPTWPTRMIMRRP